MCCWCEWAARHERRDLAPRGEPAIVPRMGAASAILTRIARTLGSERIVDSLVGLSPRDWQSLLMAVLAGVRQSFANSAAALGTDPW